MHEVLAARIRYGDRRAYVMLKRERWSVGRNVVYRLCREEGLGGRCVQQVLQRGRGARYVFADTRHYPLGETSGRVLADPKLGLPRSGRPSRKLEAGPDPVPERLMHRYVNRSTPREHAALIETPNSIFVAIIEASTE